MIVVVKKNISVLQLFISRMPKMCAILQLVSAPLNPIPIAEHFRRSHLQCEHSYGQHIYTNILANWCRKRTHRNMQWVCHLKIVGAGIMRLEKTRKVQKISCNSATTLRVDICKTLTRWQTLFFQVRKCNVFGEPYYSSFG